MISRLPRWVWPVAWLLAFVAGGVNAVGLIGFAHLAVSHLTGTTTLAAQAFARGDVAHAGHLVGIAAAFVAGAVASGALIPVHALRLGQRQTVVLGIVALLLVAAAACLARELMAGMYLAAAACGLQNAMTTAYSGAVVRTSHVSGMFTDLGIALGHVLRREPVARRRLLLCATVITGFFAGGLATAALFGRLASGVLFVHAAIVAVLALANARHVARARAVA
ncbi:MAG: YoaK family protein [Pseudomonadota bacterium]